jgi:hypothetical protein
VKTTKASLVERHYAILLSDLSKPFQDAIHVTRNLGLKYLWIDSLCIVQDDLNDWKHESTKMAHLYIGSYINIAAFSSADGSGGLFYLRREESIKLKWNMDDSWSFHDVHIRRLYPQFSEMLEEAPLNSRAWVLQGILLAPRTVHYTKDQLFWEC